MFTISDSTVTTLTNQQPINSSTLPPTSTANEDLKSKENNEPEVVILDDIAVQILGDDPSKPPLPKNAVREELTVRWAAWIS